MNQQLKVLPVALFTITCLASCDSAEIGESKDVNQDKIYMDYQLSYNEAEEDITFNSQFRFAGPDGTTLVLTEPSQVQIDAEKLQIDSSEFSGAFYETHKKAVPFTGKHSIVFTDFAGKKFENSFEFVPFTLTDVPESINPNQDLVISFSTPLLSEADYAEISSVDTDSSFNLTQYGPGKSFSIPTKEFQKQNGNTVSFICNFYKEVPLVQTPSEGGLLKTYYQLKPVKIKLGRQTIL